MQKFFLYHTEEKKSFFILTIKGKLTIAPGRMNNILTLSLRKTNSSYIEPHLGGTCKTFYMVVLIKPGKYCYTSPVQKGLQVYTKNQLSWQCKFKN